jgi:type II secretory pathway component PulF
VLEPLLIAVLGVIVGTIVVAMYLPLFDLINQLSH